MITFLENTGVTVIVPFQRDSEPFVPDASGLTWTLRGQDGTPVTGYIAVALTGVVNSYVAITVPSGANDIEGAQRFSKRYVTVQGTVGQKPFTSTVPYRLTPWLNMTAGPVSVRDFIGLDDEELPDNLIDITSAYYLVADRIGDAALATALGSGLQAEQSANAAITAQCVLNLLTSIPTLLVKKETDGNVGFERFPIDLNLLRRRAEAVLAGAVDVVSSRTSGYTMMVLVTPTDPVTGA